MAKGRKKSVTKKRMSKPRKLRNSDKNAPYDFVGEGTTTKIKKPAAKSKGRQSVSFKGKKIYG